ncbi:MAG: TetR/AcrR family transcriptional regulator [Rhodothermales bacterium]|nr:TetR/AcrR family transcriptional regulator [Rhodothermales bacterium]
MNNETTTEDQIFEAARSVFHEQGLGGARMQEIARRAGINQSMLHYYFRSKAKLFDAVFEKAIGEALPPVLTILRSDTPLLEKISLFVASYLGMLGRNPHLPGFILEELRRSPDRIREIVGQRAEGVFSVFKSQVESAVASGEIRPIAAEHLFANMLSLCVFPFVARPMLQTVMGLEDDGYDIILEERTNVVTSFIFNAVKP